MQVFLLGALVITKTADYSSAVFLKDGRPHFLIDNFTNRYIYIYTFLVIYIETENFQ